jgi:SAM-dependent methyltransferase
MNMEVKRIFELSKKPKIFTPGDSFLWTDPYIVEQMLKTHLNPNTDSASRKPETIDDIVGFCIKNINLKAGYSVLDAGCGPGLYCERFAKSGLNVTGIDISSNSISYARKSAIKKGLDIRYICGNYLEMDFENEFDAVFLIWWDFCVLDHESRKKLLRNVKRALKPEGHFIFDVSTPLQDEGTQEYRKWNTYEGGFFAPGTNLVLENRFHYPDESASLTQFTVLTDDIMKVFRIYHINYTFESISRLLNENGFTFTDIREDLTGTRYTDKSRSMGIFAYENIF